jgi:NitT/TauT family transport system permease protein
MTVRDGARQVERSRSDAGAALLSPEPPSDAAAADSGRAGARRGRPRARGALRDFLLGLSAVLVVLSAWELSARTNLVDPFFTSMPSRIGRQLWRQFSSGSILEHLRVSGMELLLGFLIAAVVGVPAGVLIGWSRTLRIAFIPLFMLWFGIGFKSKVAIVVVMAIVPIVFTIMAGVRDLGDEWIDVGRSFGARTVQIFRTVVVPASVPYVVTGLQLGFGLGVLGVVVGELFGASAGIGFLISQSAATYRLDTMFAAVIVLVAMGLSGVALIGAIGQRFSYGGRRNS